MNCCIKFFKKKKRTSTLSQQRLDILYGNIDTQINPIKKICISCNKTFKKQKSVITFPCNHFIHTRCIKKEIYSCPICIEFKKLKFSNIQ